MRFLLLLIFWCSIASATSPNSRTIDRIQATGGSTLTVPSTGTTFDTDSNTITLTNKTISTGSTWNGNTIGIGFGGTGTASTPTNGQLLIGNGTNYTLATLTGSSGISISNGSGSITVSTSPTMSVAFWKESGSAPTPGSDIYPDYIYVAGLAQTLEAVVTVPSGYVAGNQIHLRMKFYSPAYSSGNDLMQTVATLIRTGTDAISSTTNQRTSTNSAATPAGASIPYLVSFDLTDSTGKINGVSVSAGDTILVALNRGTDTDTGDIHALTTTGEALFQ